MNHQPASRTATVRINENSVHTVLQTTSTVREPGRNINLHCLVFVCYERSFSFSLYLPLSLSLSLSFSILLSCFFGFPTLLFSPMSNSMREAAWSHVINLVGPRCSVKDKIIARNSNLQRGTKRDSSERPMTSSYDPKRSGLIEKPRDVAQLNATRLVHLINTGGKIDPSTTLTEWSWSTVELHFSELVRGLQLYYFSFDGQFT